MSIGVGGIFSVRQSGCVSSELEVNGTVTIESVSCDIVFVESEWTCDGVLSELSEAIMIVQIAMVDVVQAVRWHIPRKDLAVRGADSARGVVDERNKNGGVNSRARRDKEDEQSGEGPSMATAYLAWVELALLLRQ